MCLDPWKTKVPLTTPTSNPPKLAENHQKSFKNHQKSLLNDSKQAFPKPKKALQRTLHRRNCFRIRQIQRSLARAAALISGEAKRGDGEPGRGKAFLVYLFLFVVFGLFHSFFWFILFLFLGFSHLYCLFFVSMIFFVFGSVWMFGLVFWGLFFLFGVFRVYFASWLFVFYFFGGRGNNVGSSFGDNKNCAREQTEGVLFFLGWRRWTSTRTPQLPFICGNLLPINKPPARNPR